MNQRQRPMSPFLTAYAWRYTFFNPSVIHRATGVALIFGLVALCYFFVSIASGSQTYSRALTVFSHPLFKVFFVGWVWSFFFHFLNGIRHLCWDAGHGFDRQFARASGRFVIVTATILALACCLFVFRHSTS
jgi:succinate dehydrogenase / fumarate reductase cytochrome b subunit